MIALFIHTHLYPFATLIILLLCSVIFVLQVLTYHKVNTPNKKGILNINKDVNHLPIPNKHFDLRNKLIADFHLFVANNQEQDKDYLLFDIFQDILLDRKMICQKKAAVNNIKNLSYHLLEQARDVSQENK